MKTYTLAMLVMLASVSSAWAATEAKDNYTGFHYDAYEQALKSKVLSNASRCEVIDQIVNGERKIGYLLYAINVLLREPGNKLSKHLSNMGVANNIEAKFYRHLFIEYEVAYHALRNSHYGQLKTLKDLKLLSNTDLLEIFSTLNCAQFNNQQP